MCCSPLDRQQTLADANVLQLATQGSCFIELPVRLPDDVLPYENAGMAGGFLSQEAGLDVVVERLLARIPSMGRPCWKAFLANGDVGESGTIAFGSFQAVVGMPKDVALELGCHEIERQAVKAKFIELIDTGGDLILACRKVRETLSQVCDATAVAAIEGTDSRARSKEGMHRDQYGDGGCEGEGCRRYLRRPKCQRVFSWCLPFCSWNE